MKRINAVLDDDSHNNIDDTSLPLAKVPGMYRFQFKLDHVADTYLKLNQWEKVSQLSLIRQFEILSLVRSNFDY